MLPNVRQTKDRLKKKQTGLYKEGKGKKNYPRYVHNLGTLFDFQGLAWTGDRRQWHLVSGSGDLGIGRREGTGRMYSKVGGCFYIGINLN